MKARKFWSAGGSEVQALLDIPPLYQGAVPSHFPKAQRSFQIEGEAGVLITGPPGTGKTHWATVALTRAAMDSMDARKAEARNSMRFMGATSFLLELTGTFHRDDTSPEKFHQEILDLDVLLLDDYGADQLTPFSAVSFYSILSRRFEHQRPTIVTTNLTLKEIIQRDPRLGSRFASFRIIEFAGCDRRVTRRKK